MSDKEKITLHCVYWMYHKEGEKFYSRIGTSHLGPGHKEFRYKFFETYESAILLFEKMKKYPPCQDTISIRMREINIPKTKSGIAEVLNNIVDYCDGAFQGLRFDEEKHPQLYEHCGNRQFT